MKTRTLLLLLAVIWLVSCKPVTEASTTMVLPSSIEAPVGTTEQPTVQPTPEVQALLDKSRGLTNYHYVFDASEVDSYEIWKKDNFIKKVYSEPVKLGKESYYNELYLDMDKGTAIGICTDAGVLCSPVWKKSFTLDYNQELPAVDPVALVEQVSYAEKVGTERVETRAATIIQEDSTDKKVKLWLDDYYGFPLKYVRYSLQGGEELILEKHTFSKVQVGQVKTADVTMPVGYTAAE